MAFESNQTSIGFLTAEVDLSAWQYKPVKMGSVAGTVDKADAVTDQAIGILQNDPGIGEAAEVCIHGVSKAIAGETLVLGESLGIQVTSGELITAIATNFVIGSCIEVAGDGETATILVNPNNIPKA